MHPSDQPSSSSISAAAAQWLARRDRGLSPAEQDSYLQWLRESPAHAAEIARLERSWSRLDTLQRWKPSHSARPNPDLLAPRRRRRPFWGWTTLLAAAATITIGVLIGVPRLSQSDRHAETIARVGPQRLALEDGSLLELNAEAALEVTFTPAERRVKLQRGEAHFIVARDAARPFLVTADNYTVRAIGTAFAVRFQDEELAVLVTEGKVQLEEVRASGEAGLATHELSRVTAGQLATVRPRPESTGSATVAIQQLSSPEIDQMLAWQTLRLEFNELPLQQVIEEFNRYNHRRLVIEDEAARTLKVGGSFRPDSIEAFVRVLELGFGIRSEPRGDEIVLTLQR